MEPTKLRNTIPKSIHLGDHDTAHYIPIYHRTGGFTGHEREIYKSLISRLIHEGHVIDSTFLDDQPNLRATFAAIGFDCLLDINEKICPIFELQFYKSVRIIRKLNGTIAIAFIINNFEITLRLEEFTLSLTGNKGHPNACLCYMLYCLTIGKHFNLAYYIANRMVSVTKSADMTLPYGMILTRLFEHVCVNHPYSFSNELYHVDHVMIPLSEKRVFRFKDKGKRPHLPTPTPSNFESSDSPSPTPH
ncbi:hypothetical protein Tco_0269501 [Tanacetum coccineum]